MFSRVSEILCVTGLLCLQASNSVAQVVPPGAVEASYVETVSPGPLRSNFEGWIGMHFTVGPTPIIVTALGRTRVLGNVGMHQVKLVRAEDSVDVTDGGVIVDMSQGEVGEFVYEPMTDEVILEPHTSYYLVTLEAIGGDEWHSLSTVVWTTSVARPEGAVYQSLAGGVYQTAGSPGNCYGAVDFKYARGAGLFPPSVTLEGVDDGSTYLVGDSFELLVRAVPDEGEVQEVSLYIDDTLTGLSTNVPYSMVWTNPIVGTHELYAVAVDSFGAKGTSDVVRVVMVTPMPVIQSRSGWWYWDQGGLPDTNWMSTQQVLGWKAGASFLGYGVGWESTLVDYGGDPTNKHVTTYFKRPVFLTDPSSFTMLRYEGRRDDGIVLYVNGQEVIRDNMPEGVIQDGTLALSEVDLLDANGGMFSGEVPLSLLVTGLNLIAVEVHLSSPDSEDMTFDLALFGGCPMPEIIRGPYLQSGTREQVIVRWRTDMETGGEVKYGTELGQLNNVAQSRELTLDHEVLIDGLVPGQRYYYSVGTLTEELVSGEDHFFVTAPATEKPTRIWVLGDSGTANSDAERVRDAYYSYTGDRHTDLWLMLGDNAYSLGADWEYQAAVFNMYPEMLRKSVLWSAIGNHDTAFLRNPADDIPYFEIFTFPTRGEAGGVPSGTEKYYSFDYSNIHFVCLDSMSSDRLQGGAMASWLQADLEQRTNEWLIAFWHHPPYSKGSHDSDIEIELIQMREEILPILESHGVDLVLAGHSHSYERSYLLHGHYGYSTNIHEDMVLSERSGRLNEVGPYWKPTEGPRADQGAVYVVAGSSGSARRGGNLDHPAMYISLLELGSLVVDVDDKTMMVKFLNDQGEVSDRFTIMKGDGSNLPFQITRQRLDAGVLSLTWNSVQGEYYSVQCNTNVGHSPWIFVSGAEMAQSEISTREIVIPPGVTNALYRIVNSDDD